jgi:hypothetical protein
MQSVIYYIVLNIYVRRVQEDASTWVFVKARQQTVIFENYILIMYVQLFISRVAFFIYTYMLYIYTYVLLHIHITIFKKYIFLTKYYI